MRAEKEDQEAARDAKRREVERKRMASLKALDPSLIPKPKEVAYAFV